MANNNPISGTSAAAQSTPARIIDLDLIENSNISGSMVFATDLPNETFKVQFQQLLDYIKTNLINSQYLVGDIIIGTTTDTPAARGLTGTWEPVESETVLNAVAVDNPDLGAVVGSNSVAVPVPEHNHTATFTGDEMDPHSHTYDRPEGEQNEGSSSTAVRHIVPDSLTGATSAGTPTGTVSVDNAGTPNATLNPQGKRLNVVLWQKIAV